MKRKVIFNHLAKNIRDVSSRYSLKPDHVPGVLQISVHHRHRLMALDGAPTPGTHAKPHLVQSTEQVLPTAMIRYMVVILTRYIQWLRTQNC